MDLAVKLHFNDFVVKFLVYVSTLLLIKAFYKRVKIMLAVWIRISLSDRFYVIYVI